MTSRLSAVTRRFGRLAAAVAVAAGLVATPALAEGTTVFAAASLKTALDEIDALWAKQPGRTVTVSYAASSALAKQIEQGAPADVFISADLDWMNYVEGKGLIRTETRRNMLGNTLVLVAPTAAAKPVTIDAKLPLADMIGDGKLATGDVKSVPAGKYAKAALEKLGLWESVGPKVAGAESVRAALQLVAREEAKYGIVYGSDAVSEPKVKVIGEFPAGTFPAITYPIAVTKESTSPDAAAYVGFLGSPEAGKIFESQGFTVLK